jgi:hypothetical protein
MITLSLPNVQPTAGNTSTTLHRQAQCPLNSIDNKTTTGAALMQTIRSLHKRLTALESLSPSIETNAAFTDLVNFVTQGSHLDSEVYELMKQTEMKEICKDTRRMCSEAESLLETVRDVT